MKIKRRSFNTEEPSIAPSDKPVEPQPLQLRPPRRPTYARELAPGYLWNGSTQELIPILPEDHPGYRQNQEIVTEAIRRWNQETASAKQAPSARLPRLPTLPLPPSSRSRLSSFLVLALFGQGLNIGSTTTDIEKRLAKSLLELLKLGLTKQTSMLAQRVGALPCEIGRWVKRTHLSPVLRDL